MKYSQLLFVTQIYAEYAPREDEYVYCECSTGVSTNETTMSIEFGSPDRCIYKSENDVKEYGENTDPIKVTKDGNTFCKVLQGSCFNVHYWITKTNGSCITRDCANLGFQFKGCAVNETRRLIEYQRNRNEAGGDFNMDHIKREAGMCSGERDSKTGQHTNYGMDAHGLETIHHNRLSDTMFSRTYCCDEALCNRDESVYRGKTRSEWMDLLEVEVTSAYQHALEEKAKLASSVKANILLPFILLIHSILLL